MQVVGCIGKYCRAVVGDLQVRRAPAGRQRNRKGYLAGGEIGYGSGAVRSRAR